MNPKRGGRHTTVATQLYNLDFGGFIADTPGLRELHFWDIETRLIDRYFPEMNSRRERCMKNHCTHIDQEGCSVDAALRKGDISQSRYESYCEFQKTSNSKFRRLNKIKPVPYPDAVGYELWNAMLLVNSEIKVPIS